jgi:hypothetical protein
MPLSDAALKEIRAELSALHQLKVKVEERVRALESILTPLEFDTPRQLDLAISDRGERVTQFEAGEEEPSFANRYASTGLRAAILDVLGKRGALRAPEVAQLLQKHGFKNDSKTPLQTRVYNDLWRLTQRGVVTKEDGAFNLRS